MFGPVTQNDAWGELQAVIKEGFGARTEPFTEEHQWKDYSKLESAVKYPTETTVAFFNRFQLFMTKVDHNKRGCLGTVLAFWYGISNSKCSPYPHGHMVQKI